EPTPGCRGRALAVDEGARDLGRRPRDRARARSVDRDPPNAQAHQPARGRPSAPTRTNLRLGHGRRGRARLDPRPRQQGRRREPHLVTLCYKGIVEPTDQNRRAWDEIHSSRTRAASEQLLIPKPIFDLIPDVEGKHVLHLQCATGEATAQLVERGALVTAVDVSAEEIEIARERAPDVAYYHADVHQLPLELHRGRFDLVFTGGDVLAT